MSRRARSEDIVRAPEVLLLRWLVTRLSIVLLALNRGLLEFTEIVLRQRRSYFWGRILTVISVRAVMWNATLVATAERLRNYWDADL